MSAPSPSPARQGVLLDQLRKRVEHGYPGDEPVAVALDVIADLSGQDTMPDAHWTKWARAHGDLDDEAS